MKGIAYLVQATLVLLWWFGLAINKDFYEAFQFPGIGPNAFNSFFAPDVLIITILSLVRAYKPIKELEYIIFGGFAYGAFYCINASILTNGGYLATIIMTLGLFYNVFLIYHKQAFKESNSDSLLVNGFKTLIQIICVWTMTLGIFPWLIIKAFDINTNTNQPNTYIAIILFMISSFIGLYSAIEIVRNGKGTPLPLDQTQKLVITGPYKFVRNPMAIAGVGQGIAVSIYFSSIAIFIYVIIGALIWHLVVRPIEEKNMLKRFGSTYENYQMKTKCWIPYINSHK